MLLISEYYLLCIFSPEDIIMSEGNVGRLLYIIKAGQAEKIEKGVKVE